MSKRMQAIDKHNAEEWFFNYAEGTLSAEEKKLVEAFVQQYPEMAADLHAWSQSKVVMESVEYPAMDTLLQKKKKRFGAWFWYLNGLIITAALAAVIFWPRENTEIKKEREEINSKQNHSTINSISATTKKASDVLVVETKNEKEVITSAGSSVQAGDDQSDKKHPEIKKSSFAKDQPESWRSGGCCPPYAKSTNKTKTDKKNDQPAVASAGQIEEKKEQTEEAQQQKEAMSPREPSVVINEKKEESKEDVVVKEEKKDSLPAAVVPADTMSKEEKDKRKYIMAYVNPQYSFRKLPYITKYDLVGNVEVTKNGNETGVICYSAGAEIGFKKKKRGWLHIGTQYTLLGEDSKILLGKKSVYDTATKETKVFYDHFSLQYRYHFVEMPIGYSFEIIQRSKLQIGIDVALIPGWAVTKKIIVIPAHQEGDTPFITSENSIERRGELTMGVSLSIPVKYSIGKAFIINTAPFWREQIFSNGNIAGTPAGLYQYQYAYGMQLGIMYKF